MSYLLLFFSLSNYSGCISDNLYGFCLCRNQGAPPSSPLSSPSLTPSDLEVRPAKSPCISCVAHIGYVVVQVAGHVQVTPPSGLSFAGVLINFRSGKFQALDMSFFLAKVMPDFSVNSGMTCARICTSLIFEL